MNLQSALYTGTIRHRRHSPSRHSFRYRLTLLWLDLSEQQQVFSVSPLWSGRWWSPMRFRETDYLTQHRQPEETIADAARRLVQEQLGLDIQGRICLLSQVRSFGMLFNPVSFYYCHGRHGQLEAIVAEVSNTPWRERFCYVMRAGSDQAMHHFELQKRFHVSPFLEMDVRYRMRFSTPADSLVVQMEDWRDDQRLFDATLTLRRNPLTRSTLRREALSFPFMVSKTVAGIYWQALLLWLKRTPVVTHQPMQQRTMAANASTTKEQSHEPYQS